MKIWIDADAAPRDVRNIVFKASKRLGLKTFLVANHSLSVPPAYPLVSSILVPGGPDVADDHIVEHAEAGDLVVTHDIPLAARLVPEGITVLDIRGREHTIATIGERLSVRDFMESLRSTGVATSGPPAFGDKAKREFASALDRALTRMTRQNGGSAKQ